MTSFGRRLVLYLAFASCLSCVRDGDSNEGNRLDGSVLIEAARNHPLPSRMALAGDALFLAGENDTVIYVFDRHTGQRVVRTGRLGAGPGEFRWVNSLVAYSTGADHALLAYDTKLGRLSRFDVSAGPSVSQPSVVLRASGFEAIGFVNDSTLFAVPFFARHRMVIVDLDGSVKDSVAELPLVDDGVAPSVVHEIYSPSVAQHPAGRAAAIGALHAGRIDMYDFAADSAFLADVPLPFPPTVDQAWNGAMWVHAPQGHTMFGYLSLAGTADRLYALFSGRTMSGCQQCAWFGDQIHVFNWSGQRIDVFDLTHDAMAIAVSTDNADLYALEWEPLPMVRHYRLGQPTI